MLEAVLVVLGDLPRAVPGRVVRVHGGLERDQRRLPDLEGRRLLVADHQQVQAEAGRQPRHLKQLRGLLVVPDQQRGLHQVVHRLPRYLNLHLHYTPNQIMVL